MPKFLHIILIPQFSKLGNIKKFIPRPDCTKTVVKATILTCEKQLGLEILKTKICMHAVRMHHINIQINIFERSKQYFKLGFAISCSLNCPFLYGFKTILNLLEKTYILKWPVFLFELFAVAWKNCNLGNRFNDMVLFDWTSICCWI